MPWKPRKMVVDFDLLRRSTAQEGLLYLIRRRTDNIYEHLSAISPTPDADVGDYGFEVPAGLTPIRLPRNTQVGKDDEFGLVNARMLFTPVHPLALSMAISSSIVRPDKVVTDSGDNMLLSYIIGIRMPSQMHLIQWDEYSDDQELSQILDLDDAYTEAFLKLGESLLILNRKLVPPPPLALSDNTKGDRIPTPDERANWVSRTPPSRLDILCGAWLATNPVFQLNIEYGWRRSTWLCKDFNNKVHNAIEHYDYLLDKANQEVNLLLEHDSGDDELKHAFAKQQNAARQVKRARRFYEWDADEIWSNEASNGALGSIPPEQALPRQLAEQLNSRRDSND